MTKFVFYDNLYFTKEIHFISIIIRLRIKVQKLQTTMKTLVIENYVKLTILGIGKIEKNRLFNYFLLN